MKHDTIQTVLWIMSSRLRCRHDEIPKSVYNRLFGAICYAFVINNSIKAIVFRNLFKNLTLDFKDFDLFFSFLVLFSNRLIYFSVVFLSEMRFVRVECSVLNKVRYSREFN